MAKSGTPPQKKRNDPPKLCFSSFPPACSPQRRGFDPWPKNDLLHKRSKHGFGPMWTWFCPMANLGLGPFLKPLCKHCSDMPFPEGASDLSRFKFRRGIKVSSRKGLDWFRAPQEVRLLQPFETWFFQHKNTMYKLQCSGV